MILKIKLEAYNFTVHFYSLVKEFPLYNFAVDFKNKNV